MIRFALLLAAVTLAPEQDGRLEALADDGRWDELIAVTAERLGADAKDIEALYWSGRAQVQRAESLLGSAAGRGRSRSADLARDLARSLLERAREQLALVVDSDVGSSAGARADAAEWLAYGRYLSGDDVQLAADIERWYEQEQSAYAAYVRGLIARDAGEPSAANWFGRAAEAEDARAEYALVWASTLAGDGDQRGALAAWDVARAAGAAPHALAAALQSLLPDAEDAAARLERLGSIESAEQDALLAWYRADALEQLGRLAEAEAELSRAGEQRSDATDRAHARLLALLDRPRDALSLLTPAAARGDVESLEALVDLADGLGRRRRFDVSLEVYEAALDAEPRHARALANRALTQARSGRSLDAYGALIERHPGRADLLNDAGLASWGWGRLEESRQRIESAASMPGATDARENLAALLLTQQPVDPARADSLLASVLETEPTRPRALFLRHFGRAMRSR